MAVSIADMERVALGGPGDDFGNVIELGDLNDDLGMSLLANPGRLSVTSSSADTGRSVSFAPPAPPAFDMGMGGGMGMGNGGSGLGLADVSPLEPLEPIMMDAIPLDGGMGMGMGMGGGGGMDINFVREPASSSSNLYSNNQTSTASPSFQLGSSPRDPEAEKKEKFDLLNKLQRLEKKGFPVSRKFTMDNSLDEMKEEYARLVDARNLEASIKFQRQMMMGAITGMEWLNNRFDPFDLKLDGWSESVHENVEDFDEIFEELYDKYKDRGKMSPEMRLMLAVGGSGFMFHVSNSFFRSKMPSMDDVLRNNPELARQMAQAAASQAGPGFGNFMGMAMGASGPTAPPSMPTAPANGGPPNIPMAQTGAFFASSGAMPGSMPVPNSSVPPPMSQAQQQPRATARRDMTGPSGVDDILRTFEEVRRAETMAASMPADASSGFNPMMPQPAVAAASVISADEMRSHAESVATANGRRRRRTQAPVGNTISLNV